MLAALLTLGGLALQLAAPANALTPTSTSAQAGYVKAMVASSFASSGDGYDGSVTPEKLDVGRDPQYAYGQWICVTATMWFRSGTVTGSGWSSRAIDDSPRCTYTPPGQDDATSFANMSFMVTSGNFIHFTYRIDWWDYYGATRLASATYDSNLAADYHCANNLRPSCSVAYGYAMYGFFLN